MSSLIIPVAAIEDIMPHENADVLELATILGWQMVVPKGIYRKGDKVTYFPIDTVLPLELSEKYGVTKYLSNGRIRCAKLRGEPSFGLAVCPDSNDWEVGQDVTEHYMSLGVKKYDPPLRVTAGDAEEDHPLFIKYTNMEDMRNFPDIFKEGEPVVLTEKIDGTNSRVGIIEGEFMAGSKELRRQRPADNDTSINIYWYPLSLVPVHRMLEDLGKQNRQVILFGEVYGRKVQSLKYGCNNTNGYRAFDIMIDGKYLDHNDFLDLCIHYGVETVPIVSYDFFHLHKIKRHSSGNTLLMEKDAHRREGLVVKPLKERRDPKLGRVILKYVSDVHLFGKQQEDYTDV